MIRLLAVIPVAVFLQACALLETRPPEPPPAPTQAEFVVPEGTEFVSSLFGYSQAVRVGPWVTTSAIPGFDVQKRAFPEDFAQQAYFAFELLRAVLEASGASMDDVTEITTYQLDMSHFNEVINARNEAFGDHRPTWVPVGVKELLMPTMQFQVSARAYAPLDGTRQSSSASPAAAPRVVQQIEAPAEPAASEPGTETKERRPFRNRPGY